jgi:ABC-2 type transport system ATP-binding protein
MIIEASGLWKTYGGFDALRGLDLSVPEGSVFALLGANGAGKTTAIRVLLNIITATRGTATVLGVNSRAIGPATLRQIGYVSESQALPARLRVDDFFTYVRSLYPTWQRGLERQLRRQLGLPADRRIGALSHGMRLKLALACALPFRPRLLILDEPFSGLDALVRDEIISGFIQQLDQLSILISSHELDELERLATHVAFLDAGRLLFQGTLAELRQRAGSTALSSPARPSSLRDIFISMTRAERERARELR